MKQRGQKGINQLTVVKSETSAIERPEPPPELTVEQKCEWVRVVNSLPADWFQDYSTQALVQYTRHLVNARRIAQLIEDMCSEDSFDALSYDKLLSMQERETRILLSLATKMRLTQQSTYSDRKGKEPIKARKLWEM